MKIKTNIHPNLQVYYTVVYTDLGKTIRVYIFECPHRMQMLLQIENLKVDVDDIQAIRYHLFDSGYEDADLNLL